MKFLLFIASVFVSNVAFGFSQCPEGTRPGHPVFTVAIVALAAAVIAFAIIFAVKKVRECTTTGKKLAIIVAGLFTILAIVSVSFVGYFYTLLDCH